MKKIILLAICFLLVLQAPVLAEIYKWVDENGKTHFTDNMGRIPAEYRDQNKPMQEVIDPRYIYELDNADFNGSKLAASFETKIVHKSDRQWIYSWQLHVTNKNNSAMQFSPEVNFLDLYGKKMQTSFQHIMFIGSQEKKTFKGIIHVSVNLVEAIEKIELKILKIKKTDEKYLQQNIKVLSVKLVRGGSKKYSSTKCCRWRVDLENQGEESAIFHLGLRFYRDGFLVQDVTIATNLHINPLESKTHYVHRPLYASLVKKKFKRGMFRIDADYEAYVNTNISNRAYGVSSR